MANFEIPAQAPSESPGLIIDAITKKLTGRNFPMKLISTGLDSIIEDALAKLNAYAPVTTFAAFDTKAGVQNYSIFDPAEPDLAGFAADAVSIKEVYWNPSGDFTDMDVFSPSWFTMSHVLMFAGGSFHRASDMIVLRQKLNSWNTNFGTQGFDVVGPMGEPGSVLRLFPTPPASGIKVIVEFMAALKLDYIGTTQLPNLMDWVSHYAAEALANKYAATAGIELLGFADSTSAMKYWEGKAKWFYDQALISQGGSHGEVART